MNINKKLTGTALTLSVSGRLDTLTAPMLEQERKASCGNITELTLDFRELQYISSAGLRVVLGAHKAMKGNEIPLFSPSSCEANVSAAAAAPSPAGTEAIRQSVSERTESQS